MNETAPYFPADLHDETLCTPPAREALSRDGEVYEPGLQDVSLHVTSNHSQQPLPATQPEIPIPNPQSQSQPRQVWQRRSLQVASSVVSAPIAIQGAPRQEADEDISDHRQAHESNTTSDGSVATGLGGASGFRMIESYKGVTVNSVGGSVPIVSPPPSPLSHVILTPVDNTLHCLLSMKGELDIWSVIKAMHQHTETPYQDFLCQEMRRFELQDIEFYLPQLCHLLLHRFNITALQRFLLDLSTRSVYMALRVYFIVRAAVEDDIPETLDRAKFLEEKLIDIVMNAHYSTSNFWADELYMIRSLTQASTTLNSIPEHLQKQVLHFTLQQLNAKLSVGLFLPTTKASHNFHCILNIITQDAFCLGTKARTPYMVFVESAELGGQFSSLETTLMKLLEDGSEPPKESPTVLEDDFSGPPLETIAKNLVDNELDGCHASGSISTSTRGSLFSGEDLAASPRPTPRMSHATSDVSNRTSSKLHHSNKEEREKGGEEEEIVVGSMERFRTVRERGHRPAYSEGGGTPSRTRSVSQGHIPGFADKRKVLQDSKEPRPIEYLTRKLSQTAMKEGKLVSVGKKFEGRKRKDMDQWAAMQKEEGGGMKLRVLMEIEELREMEKAGAAGESDLGDSYFINSVEEFYCDPSRGKKGKEGKEKEKDKERNKPKGTPKKTQTGKEEDWVMIDHRSKSEYFALAYPELFTDKKKRIQESSLYGNLPGWNLHAVIVKSEDDLRQEQMAMQLIKCFDSIFKAARLPLWIYPYEIVATSSTTGFIQVVPDAISLHSLKNRIPNNPTLSDYFICTYGDRKSPAFVHALVNFVESLAAYSLVCYILQIKDRHNGNILLDAEGHIIHIDYGFLLTISPGNWHFETAPFKLTTEYMDLMGGEDSEMFEYFKQILFDGFMEARKHYEKIVLLVEMMMPAKKISCLGTYENTIVPLLDRFKLTMSVPDLFLYVTALIRDALGSWRTLSYDEYQRWTNGILY